MKRGAEKQMSKDDDSDEEIQETSEGQGFRKADDSVLATRRIRALPRRSMVATPPPSATIGTGTPNVATSPRLGGFSGFGFPESNNSSFTFTPPATTANNTPQLGASSASVSNPFSAPPLSSNAPVAPTASNTAKTFASFLAGSPRSSDAKGSAEASSTTISPASKYYTSLRGLNLSFISAISKATEGDPFVDMTDIINRYTDLRLQVQKNFDGSATDLPKNSSSTPASQPKAPTMPAPPTKFSGFGSSNPSSTTSTPTLGSGFVPKSTSNSTSIPSPGFTFPSTTSSMFGSNSSATQTTPSFNASSSDSGTSFFGKITTRSSASSPFGASSSSPDAPSSKTTPTLSANPFAAADKSAPSNFFGSSATPSSTAAKPSPFGFSGFPKSASGSGSIGNPVGFTFANPSKVDSNNTSNASSPETTGNNEAAKDENARDEITSNGDEAGGGGSNSGLMTSNPHDEEGEGEEDEETVHAIKLKAYRMKKAEEKGGQGWVELGHGVLRLKKHKGTDARRMLLRNSNTGKININFNIYAGLKPSQVKKAITFVGHDNGTAQTYSVRLQNDEQAAVLKDVIDREVAFIKAKSEG